GGFLDDVAAGEAELFIHVLGDDVVPVAEAVVELLDAGLGLFPLVVVGVALPRVLLADPLALGLLWIDDGGFLVVGLLVGGRLGGSLALPFGRLGAGGLGVWRGRSENGG